MLNDFSSENTLTLGARGVMARSYRFHCVSFQILHGPGLRFDWIFSVMGISFSRKAYVQGTDQFVTLHVFA